MRWSFSAGTIDPDKVFLFWAFVILWGIMIGFVLDAQTQVGCLQAGYPAHTVTWALQRYCLRRVNQTDMVVPYDRR